MVIHFSNLVQSLLNVLFDVPALFLVDAGSSLWLWQGWWGEEGQWEDEGVGEGRWQAERRAAMTTALQYHRLSPMPEKAPLLLVWAGLEPLAFTNFFPSWTDRDDIAELNIRVTVILCVVYIYKQTGSLQCFT